MWIQHTKLCMMTLPFIVSFHQENTRPPTTARIVETIRQFGREQLRHPPYSPDLALLIPTCYAPSKG